MTHTNRAYYIKRLEVVKELLNEFRSNTSLWSVKKQIEEILKD
jgi:hypothetical protein